MSEADLAPTLGWDLIDWIEDLLVHGPGDVQGRPIVLDDEWRALTLRAYELHPRRACHCGQLTSGLVLAEYPWRCRARGCGQLVPVRRRFDRAVLSRAKGRAKSELAGMFCCGEALGPVRFDGWGADGEPVGRPVTSPEVLCVATEEGQAGNTYGNVEYMLREGPVAEEYPGLDVGRTRVLLPDGGEIAPITTGATSKDGGKSTFVVFDETHLLILRSLKELHGVIRRNLGKRKDANPWSLETSTRFRPGQGSVGEATEGYALEVAAGRVRDPRLLWDHREAPRSLEECGDDDEALLANLAAAYGPAAAWMDLERLLAEVRDPQNDPADVERYWFNRRRSSSEQWMPEATWSAQARPGLGVDDGEAVALGLDGSDVDDATVLVGCRLSDGHLFAVDAWLRPEGPEGEGWAVPRGEVKVAVTRARRRLRVVRFYADPPGWRDEIGEWSVEFGGDVVAEWWTFRDQHMAAALEQLHTAVTIGHATHDDDPVVTRHVLNAHKLVKPAPADDPDGRKELVLIRKPVRGGPQKIDGAVAATLAYKARGDAVAAGAGRRRRSVYEDRGVMVV